MVQVQLKNDDFSFTNWLMARKDQAKKNKKTIQNSCTHSTAYSYESKADVFCLLRM